MNQWEREAKTRNWRKARENACDQSEGSKAKPKEIPDYFRHSIENHSIAELVLYI